MNSEFWGAVHSISWSLTSQCRRSALVTMPAQSTRNFTIQGRGGNQRFTIQTHLEGLPELGDSSLIRGNAPASAKRLVKNVFDEYGVGRGGCFGDSVGGSVRLVEVSANGYHQRIEPAGLKGRLEASTVAEVTISPGTSRWIMRPDFAYTCGNCRDAERSRDPARGMYCLSDRHVSSTCQYYDLDLRFDRCCSTPLVVLGHVLGKNGLGVTQNMNINYHAPVSL